MAEIRIELIRKNGKKEVRGLRRTATALQEINPATGRWKAREIILSPQVTEKREQGDILP